MTHDITAGRNKGRQCEILFRNGTSTRVRFSDGKEGWVRSAALVPIDTQSRYAAERGRE